jgi:Flp pilus assembly protein TadG
LKRTQNILKLWLGDENASTVMEVAVLMPVLMTLLFGTFDMGNGILTNQKVVSAAAIAADLLTREESVATADINDAMEAGRLAIEPFDTTSVGYDIVSVEFDENDDPQILWRETVNMDAITNLEDRAAGLGVDGEGVIIVWTHYSFQPLFAGFVVDNYDMEEIAFARGRRSPTVTRSD